MSLNEQEKATNAETWEHINLVMKLLASAQIELMRRQFTHDRSKLGHPEVSTFTEFTPKLKDSTYGSDEYKGFLAAMAPALKHHYENNRHHPEFFENIQSSPHLNDIEKDLEGLTHLKKIVDGDAPIYPDDIYLVEQIIKSVDRRKEEAQAPINNMNLFDIIEMFIDWVAAGKRHADGNINKSIQINTDRFSLSPQLVRIFENTIPWVKDEFEDLKTQKDLH